MVELLLPIIWSSTLSLCCHENSIVPMKDVSFLCRTLETCQLSDEYRLSFTTDFGCFHLKDTNRIYDSIRKEIFTIKEGDSTTAKVTIQGQVACCIRRKRWETRVQASSEMWCDEQFFYVKNQLTASHYSKEIWQDMDKENRTLLFCRRYFFAKFESNLGWFYYSVFF